MPVNVISCKLTQHDMLSHKKNITLSGLYCTCMGVGYWEFLIDGLKISCLSLNIFGWLFEH